jgi:hypothetical protein
VGRAATLAGAAAAAARAAAVGRSQEQGGGVPGAQQLGPDNSTSSIGTGGDGGGRGPGASLTAATIVGTAVGAALGVLAVATAGGAAARRRRRLTGGASERGKPSEAPAVLAVEAGSWPETPRSGPSGGGPRVSRRLGNATEQDCDWP